MASAANLDEKRAIIRDMIMYSDLAGVLISNSCLHGINNIKSLRSHWASKHPDICLSDVHVHEIRKALFEETQWEPLLGSVHKLPFCVGGKVMTHGQLQYQKAPELHDDPLLRIPFLPVTFGLQCPQCFKFACKKDPELSEHLVSTHAMSEENVRAYVSGLDKVPLQSLGKRKREELFRVYFPTQEELQEALLRYQREFSLPFYPVLSPHAMNLDSNFCLPLQQSSNLFLTNSQTLAPASAPSLPFPSTDILPPPALSISPTSGAGERAEAEEGAGEGDGGAIEEAAVHSSSPGASSATSSHSSSLSSSPCSNPLIPPSSPQLDGYLIPSAPPSSKAQTLDTLSHAQTLTTRQIAAQTQPLIFNQVLITSTMAATATATATTTEADTSPTQTRAQTRALALTPAQAQIAEVMSSAQLYTPALTGVSTPAPYDVPLRSMIEKSSNYSQRSIMLERLRFPELLFDCGFTTLGGVSNILCAPAARVTRLIQTTDPCFTRADPGNVHVLKALTFIHATKLDICDLKRRISQAVLSYLSRAASVANAAPNFIGASVNAHNGVALTSSHSRVTSGIRRPSQNRNVNAGVPNSNGDGRSGSGLGCDGPVRDSGHTSGSGIPFFRPVTRKATEKAYARYISRLVLALTRLIVCELSISADRMDSYLHVQTPSDSLRLSDQEVRTLKRLVATLLREMLG